MYVLYAGVTEKTMTNIFLEGGLNSTSYGGNVIKCHHSCTGNNDTNIRDALADALVLCEDSPNCYVLEIAVNESQVIHGECPEVDMTQLVNDAPGVPISSIIRVYKFEMTHKLRVVGAILASMRGYKELSDRFGINYLGESSDAFLGWFCGLAIKDPILGVNFFSVNNIPVSGKRVIPINEIRDTLRTFTEAARIHADRMCVETPDSLFGILKINGIGNVPIDLSHFLDTASPIVLAEVLKGNSREIVSYLEAVNPVCTLAALTEDLLYSLVPGCEFSLSVEFDKSAMERELLQRDPEKYALMSEASRKMENMNKGL